MANFVHEITNPPEINPGLLHEELASAFGGVFTGLGYNSRSLRLRFSRNLTNEEMLAGLEIFSNHNPGELSSAQQAQALVQEEKVSNILYNMTVAQADAWISDNVVDLASAKQALKIIARMLIVLR